MNDIRRSQMAYRCPDCGYATVGFLGGLSAVSDMLRLKCQCGESALDVKKQSDGKIRLTVPCVYCKESHGFVLSPEVVISGREVSLSCPYSGMGIAFLGDEKQVGQMLDRSLEELNRILTSFEAKELSDIQPMEDGEEQFCDPGAYDSINFLLRDLESEGKVSCSCTREGAEGEYSLRFTDEGIRVVCDRCGAYLDLYMRSQAAAEEYLSLDKMELK